MAWMVALDGAAFQVGLDFEGNFANVENLDSYKKLEEFASQYGLTTGTGEDYENDVNTLYVGKKLLSERYICKSATVVLADGDIPKDVFVKMTTLLSQVADELGVEADIQTGTVIYHFD